MVSKIIDGQVAEGLLREAPISFRDVETIKRLFVERLRTAYHMRVSYPSDIKTAEPAHEPEADDSATPPPHGDTAQEQSK